MRVRPCVAGLAILLLPASTLAQGGVIELNHALALAGDSTLVPPDPPGYPIEVRQRGSYRLTSDLQVPAGTHGILLKADEVHLDLGGFAVRGPGVCLPGFCPAAGGAGSGVVHGTIPGAFIGGGLVTLRNGSVSGFGESCIRLFDGARVENVRVLYCGEHGIHLRQVSTPGIAHMAIGNTVSNTAQSSLVIEGGGQYRDNVLAIAGLAVASPTIVGGTATGGNLCDDGRCSRRGTRRYYLTNATFDGSQALNACDPGYHMASRWEIADPSELEYDSVRGVVSSDAGSGPPAPDLLGSITPGYLGWSHTGSAAFADPRQDVAGLANCGAWTSNDSLVSGTVNELDVGWGNPGVTRNSLWFTYVERCSQSLSVWCIED